MAARFVSQNIYGPMNPVGIKRLGSSQIANMQYYALLVDVGEEKYDGEITFVSKSHALIDLKHLIIPFSVRDYDCWFYLSRAYERIKTMDGNARNTSWKSNAAKSRAAAYSLDRLIETLLFDLAKTEPIINSDPRLNIGGARYSVVHSDEICTKLYSSVGYRVSGNMKILMYDLGQASHYLGQDMELTLGSHLGPTLRKTTTQKTVS